MKRFIHLAISFCALTLASVAVASDTTFTYQGELKENGNSANGSFDMDFEVWDAAIGGDQIGSTITLNGVQVVNGRFAVELDFGATAFDNSGRWLEITVNGTELTPRQPVTRTPYAIQTRGIFADESHNVGIGTTTPVWELEVANPAAGDSAEIGVTAADSGGALAAYSSTFPLPHLADRVSLFTNAFDATGLDLRADGVTSDIRMYTGGFDASHERMRITDTGNIGIGTTGPVVPLEVHNRNTGEILRLESDQTLGYLQFREGSTTRAILGFGDEADLLVNALPNSFAIDGASTALHFAVDSDASKGITIDTFGNVGIGTPTPTAILDVGGIAGRDGVRFPDNTLQKTAATVILSASVVVDPPTILAHSSNGDLVTIPGVEFGDVIVANPGQLAANIVIAQVRVWAANEVFVDFANVGNSDQNPPASTWQFRVIK